MVSFCIAGTRDERVRWQGLKMHREDGATKRGESIGSKSCRKTICIWTSAKSLTEIQGVYAAEAGSFSIFLGPRNTDCYFFTVILQYSKCDLGSGQQRSTYKTTIDHRVGSVCFIEPRRNIKLSHIPRWVNARQFYKYYPNYKWLHLLGAEYIHPCPSAEFLSHAEELEEAARIRNEYNQDLSSVKKADVETCGNWEVFVGSSVSKWTLKPSKWVISRWPGESLVTGGC